jgi:hypothetical protein
MPTVAPTIARIATGGKLEAEPWQNPPDLENHFLHRWMWYLRTVALRRPIFEQNKGSATIRLGLNYCSMCSLLSPFRDTVPLKKPKKQYAGSLHTIYAEPRHFYTSSTLAAALGNIIVSAMAPKICSVSYPPKTFNYRPQN